MKDPEKLHFPKEITEEIGLPKNTINNLKRKGCKFFGKKTCIKWVREFIEAEAVAIAASPASVPAEPHLSERR